jgi:hypothetical protein
MGWSAAIKAICDLIAAFLKLRVDGKPVREENKKDEVAQEISKEVGTQDVDVLAARVAAIRRRLHERVPGKNRIPPAG